MNLLVVIAAAVVVGSSIFFRTSHKIDQKNEVLGESIRVEVDSMGINISPSPEISIEISPSPKQSQTSSLAPQPTQIVKISPTQTPAIDTQNSLIYPQSSSIGGGKYSSTDSPDKVTEWYKNKINSEGYNSKSFVTTKSNDKVLNKLSASKNSQSLLVEISKNDSNSQTEIYILLDN